MSGDDDLPTSFDALAHEHNLSMRLRDLCRIFFVAGQRIGRRQAQLAASQPEPEGVDIDAVHRRGQERRR